MRPGWKILADRAEVVTEDDINNWLANKEREQAVMIFERMNNRDRHTQQSKKRAGVAVLKVNNHVGATDCTLRSWMLTNTIPSTESLQGGQATATASHKG